MIAAFLLCKLCMSERACSLHISCVSESRYNIQIFQTQNNCPQGEANLHPARSESWAFATTPRELYIIVESNNSNIYSNNGNKIVIIVIIAIIVIMVLTRVIIIVIRVL